MYSLFLCKNFLPWLVTRSFTQRARDFHLVASLSLSFSFPLQDKWRKRDWDGSEESNFASFIITFLWKKKDIAFCRPTLLPPSCFEGGKTKFNWKTWKKICSKPWPSFYPAMLSLCVCIQNSTSQGRVGSTFELLLVCIFGWSSLSCGTAHSAPANFCRGWPVCLQ